MCCAGIWVSQVAGGAPAPAPSISARIEQTVLQDHVQYLASDALRGRKPLTHGSRLARAYIAAQFRAYGLRPWANESGYEQSVYIGTNVIGVLPGSDESLRDQFVLVGAHYDHLGARHVGAADNAAGVAALLGMAERMAHDPIRPRRSVVFACFDREETMLFGAYAFTCRPDFDKNEIAAVVNMDMLGRDFLDSMKGVLFAVGLDRFPGLHQAVSQAGHFNGMEILSVGSDVVGPRSDHVAFEGMTGPCLFFSCGMFPDYHTKRDTPDKLDGGALKRSADTVSEVVRALADAPVLETASTDAADRDELKTFQRILPVAFATAEKKKPLSDSDKNAYETAMTRLAAAESVSPYTTSERQTLIWEIMPALAPVLGPLLMEGSEAESRSTTRPHRQTDYSRLVSVMLHNHGDLASESEIYRAFVSAVLQRKPFSVVRPLHFTYRHSQIPDQDYRSEEQDGHLRVSALLSSYNLNSQITFVRPHGNISSTSTQFDVSGTKDEVIDFTLLWWPKKSIETKNAHGKHPLHLTFGFDEAYASLLTRITGEDHEPTRDAWVQWNLNRLGFSDERTWVTSLLKSANIRLAALAVKRYEDYGKPPNAEYVSSVCELCRDTTKEAGVRVMAMNSFYFTPPMLLALANALPEQTRYRLCFPEVVMSDAIYDKTFPFYTDYRMAFHRSLFEKYRKESAQAYGEHSLSDFALMRLRTLTGENFGKDAAAWRAWIEQHPRLDGSIKRRIKAENRLIAEEHRRKASETPTNDASQANSAKS